MTVVQDDTASGRFKVTDFGTGDALVYDPVNFRNITGVQTKASGAGTLSLRWNAADAAPFATIDVPAGAGWQTVSTALSTLPTGTGTLFVTSSGGVDVDSFVFQGAGVADVTGPTATVTATPAAPTGANGWYTTSPVSVNVTFADPSGVTSNTRQYRIVSNANQCGAADATWTAIPNNGNISVANEGTNVICYRANDNGGNTVTGNYTVRIDTQAPGATLPEVVGGVVDDAQYLVPTVADVAGGSGSPVVTGMRLDGTAVSIATPINTASLTLGAHTLVVTTRDGAGNVGTSTISFTVKVTFDSLRALIDRYTTSKAVTATTAAGLKDRLAKAEQQLALGRESAAVSYLEQFVTRTNSQVKSTGVRALFVRDARALIDSIER